MISGKKITNPLLKTSNQWIKTQMQFGISNGLAKEKEIKGRV